LLLVLEISRHKNGNTIAIFLIIISMGMDQSRQASQFKGVAGKITGNKARAGFNATESR